MTPRKTQHNSHCSYTPNDGATVRRRTPVERASASAARNAPRNSTSPASASLPMKRSWSCLMSFVRGSGRDGRLDDLGSVQDGLKMSTDGHPAGGGNTPASERQLTRVTAGETATQSLSESNQRQIRNGWGHRPRKTIDHRNGLRVGAAGAVQPAASEFMDATGRRDDHLIHSSGDGLGIHQPGSMTRGTRAKVKTPSGRACKHAMCPAVARSYFDRRAA